MEMVAWRWGELDERYLVLEQSGQAAAVCHLLGGHRSTEEDSAARRLMQWWSGQHQDALDARGLLSALVEISAELPEVLRMAAAAVCIVRTQESVCISYFGSYLSLYRNGRKVCGGREHAIDWRYPLYRDVSLNADPSAIPELVSTHELELAQDEFIVGTPFLDCYASEADLVELRSDKREAVEKLREFGNRLAEKADSSVNTGAYRCPKYRNDRLLLLLKP